MEDWVTQQERAKRDADEVRRREREEKFQQSREASRRYEERDAVIKPIRDIAFTNITNACQRGASALNIEVIKHGDVTRHGLEVGGDSTSLVLEYRGAGVMVRIPKGWTSVDWHIAHWIGVSISEDNLTLRVSFRHTPGRDRGGYRKYYKKECSMDWRSMNDNIASEMARWLLVNEGTPWQMMRVIKSESESLWSRLFG